MGVLSHANLRRVYQQEKAISILINLHATSVMKSCTDDIHDELEVLVLVSTSEIEDAGLRMSIALVS